MLSIASLTTFVQKKSNCSHILAPFKLYRKLTGKDNVIEALENVQSVVKMLTDTYNNPRTCRNYMAGLKVCVLVPEVATYFTSAKKAHIIGIIDVELQKLNNMSYKFTDDKTMNDLIEENALLRRIIEEYDVLLEKYLNGIKK